MDQLDQYVAIGLDEQRHALPLQTIERIVRAVEETVLPVLDPERWPSDDGGRSLHTAIRPPVAHAA